MKIRSARLVLFVATLLLTANCSHSSPTEPVPVSTTGRVRFIGTAAGVCPDSPSTMAIYVDRQKAGTLQFPGELDITLEPGTHSWSIFPDGPRDPLDIQAGKTVTIEFQATCDPT